MHARIHDDEQAQDIRKMGGLKEWMRFTYFTFLVSVLAIAGCPLTSGFFSKDEILFRAFVNVPVNPLAKSVKEGKQFLDIPHWFGPALYVAGWAAAVMTAFYMFRLLFLTFHGKFRGWEVGRPSRLPSSPDHLHDDLTSPGYPPHESPWQMTVPLMILGTLAAVAGILNMGMFHFTPMDHWLEPVFRSTTDAGLKIREGGEHLEIPLAAGGVAAFAIGTGFAWWMYVKEAGEPAKQLAVQFPALRRLLLDKWRVDELYEATVLSAVDALGDTAASFDETFVDGVNKAVALVVAGAGSVLRLFQNGVVHMYAAFMVVGFVFMAAFFVMPHANATVTDAGNGDFVIEAGPGIGYTFRWDADGNGKFDNEKGGLTTVQKVHLEPEQYRWVKLEVTNAFGFTAENAYLVSRPKVEKPENIQLGMR
jgi:NADH-quinone oxidoreductase subunit L